MLTSFALRDGSRTLTNPTPLLTPSGSSAPHACHISRRFHLMPPVHQRTHTALMPSTYRRTHLVHLRESHATPLATGTTTPTYASTNNRRFARLSSACGRSRRPHHASSRTTYQRQLMILKTTDLILLLASACSSHRGHARP